MRKFIISAVAAGALAVGGAASAQDFGSVISSLLGMFLSDSTQQTSTTVTVHRDQFGRHYYTDHYGRQVYLSYQGTDQYGRQLYTDPYGRQLALQVSTPQYGNAIIGYDSWGRPIYGSSGMSSFGGQYPYGGQYAGRGWDHDGDGVANARDRWPNDPRYR